MPVGLNCRRAQGGRLPRQGAGRPRCRRWNWMTAECLSESAPCTYLEGLHPAPNLMGEGFDDAPSSKCTTAAWSGTGCCRSRQRRAPHHPGAGGLEQPPQFPEFGHARAPGCANRRAGWTIYAGRAAWIAGEALHHCRHHGVLCPRIRQTDKIQPRRRVLPPCRPGATGWRSGPARRRGERGRWCHDKC